jgi:recombination protein RecR
MAMKLVRGDKQLAGDLIRALEHVRSNLRCCSLCGSVTSVDEDPCRLCTGPGRDASQLCVVEEPTDVASIERSGGFHGRYHALMGRVSPMKGEGPGELRIQALMDRVKKERPTEVILALSTTVEGDSTASYIAELLKGQGVKVTRLAFGLPADSGVTYSDPVTLEKALKGRQEA